MDENKTPLYSGVIGFCLSFVLYQVIFVIFNRSGAGIMTWLMAFLVATVVGVVAFVAAQKLT